MNATLPHAQISLMMSDNLTYRETFVEGMEGAVAAPRPTIGDRMRGWFQTLAELPRRRAVIEELRTLSDRELADIGISRADVGRVFDSRFRTR